MSAFRRTRRRWAITAAAVGLTAVLAGCADFSAQSPQYSATPSLTPAIATPVLPQPAMPGQSPSSTSGSTSTSSSKPADPCTPTDPSVIAACLSAPWGLVPLADGRSALVGERTTGRILKVAYQQKPVVVATVAGIDASGDGGLLGLAVSPSYSEDNLIYAYVTTKTDNRIVRIAPGATPKAIFTGIPKGSTHNGGPIMFVKDKLFVGTGDTGRPQLSGEPTSLAGKLLRLDEFGKADGADLNGTSPVYASGFTQPTGMCLLPTGKPALLDHRSTTDLLLSVDPAATYTTPKAGATVESTAAKDGGANDCAAANGVLATTSLAGQKVTGVQMSPQGTFTGNPQTLLDNKYGRLLTIAPGPNNNFWMTTSNKDGQGKPIPADDRVIVLPNDGSAGGGPD
jgi:glucose/arabinose dehydrogenase